MNDISVVCIHCGGYYEERPRDSDGETSWHPTCPCGYKVPSDVLLVDGEGHIF